MKDTILEVKDLSVTFTQYDRGFSRRTLHAVEKMDLSVRAGEIVAVVGSSGSGKSLLAHAIMGILPYNSAMDGEIRFLGTPLTAERVKKLRGHEIVFVPQSVSYLDPLMKIGDQIRNGKKDHSVKEKCLAVLKRYGLAPDIREKYPFQLSGGMTRRVLISTAVMETPRLVIADEPTKGLDAVIRNQVYSVLRQIYTEHHCSMLVITHDLALARRLCDDIRVLYMGRIIEQGTAEEIFAHPAHPYTIGLMASKPVVGRQVDKLYSIPGKVPNPINMPNYCYFKDRCEMCVNGCEGDYPCEVSISPTHKVSCYRYYDGKRPDLEEVVEEELAEGKENGKEGE